MAKQDPGHKPLSEAEDFAVLHQLLIELFPTASSRPKIIGFVGKKWILLLCARGLATGRLLHMPSAGLDASTLWHAP